MLTTHRARAVWTGEVWLEDAAVVTRGTEVVEVRPGRSQDGPALDGLLCPGLVNAHAHLELTHLAGRVPPGPDFPSWLSSLLAQRADTASADEAATLVRAASAATGQKGRVVACVANGEFVEDPAAVQAFDRHQLERLLRPYGRARLAKDQPFAWLVAYVDREGGSNRLEQARDHLGARLAAGRGGSGNLLLPGAHSGRSPPQHGEVPAGRCAGVPWAQGWPPP